MTPHEAVLFRKASPSIRSPRASPAPANGSPKPRAWTRSSKMPSRSPSARSCSTPSERSRPDGPGRDAHESWKAHSTCRRSIRTASSRRETCSSTPSPRTSPSAPAPYRPELAAQVWGRARARVLRGPSALGNGTSGALNLDPATLIGIQGDAVYASSLPRWSLPVEYGGGDDGKVGRFRIKGYMRGSYRTPALRDQRMSLRNRAEKQGLSVAIDTVQASTS